MNRITLVTNSCVSLLATCLLAACVSDLTASTPATLTSGQIAQIKEDATRDFLDPTGAQFRDIRAVDVTLASGAIERRVCGEVNGKNAYGGYTGFTFFGGVIVSGRFQNLDFPGACEA